MKKVLITGASRGIGAAIAKLFAKNDFLVHVNYNKSETEMLEIAKKSSCIAVKADVSDYQEVKQMFEKIGGIDILINNAGIAQQKLFTEISPVEWQKMISVNLTSVYNTCHNALPYMINKKSGCIINISSMWGICGASCEVHYSAAKAGVIGFTKALAKEVGPSGVRVNCIAPGVIDTDMNKGLDEESIKMIEEETPLGKIGLPDDIAQCALFLATKGDFITGQTISPNGGLVI